MAEVGALLELLVKLLGLLCGGLDHVRGRGFRHRDQDIGQAVLFGKLDLAHVRGEEVLHLLLADLDALGDPALTHTADHHLATDLLAGVGVGQAVAGEGGLELLQAHAVALGDGAHRLVQLLVGDTDAGAVADLLLDVLDDQAFQHLLGQHVLGRQRRAALEQRLVHFTQALVELALHDHIVVDDGDDPVQWYHFGMREGAKECCAQCKGAQPVT